MLSHTNWNGEKKDEAKHQIPTSMCWENWILLFLEI